MSLLNTFDYIDLSNVGNANNYEHLTNPQFVKIISGEEFTYTQPTTANAQWNYRQDLEKSRKLGEEPKYFTIQLPSEYWSRGREYREQMYMTRPRELKPDIDKPLVNRIAGAIYWFRGINYPEQNIPKDLIHPISLRYCQFENTFNINSVKSNSSFHLSNCQFLATSETNATHHSFSKSEFQRIEINQISGSKNDAVVPLSCLSFQEIKANVLMIRNCLIKEVIIDCSNGEIEEIYIQDSIIEEIRIVGGNIKKCHIERLVKGKNISISGTFDQLIIEGIEQFGEDVFTENLYLNLSSSKKGTILLRNIWVSNLNFNGDNANDILIKGVRVDKLSLSELVNLATIRFRDIQCNTLLTIWDSTLGKTEVSNISFSKKAKGKIVQTNIEELSIHNTRFPDKILGKDEKDVEGTREAYRQLKYASAKHGNRLAELNYQRLEMDAHFKSLNYKTHFGDKLILLLSKVSSSYGQNWLQALGSTAAFGLITYTIYCWSLGFRIGSDWDLFWKLSSYFLEYLNPLHKADFITDDLATKRTGWSIAWDNLSRVINGFFVYQMIQAFRKFGKS